MIENNIKIDENGYKNIPIYYIAYMMIKDLNWICDDQRFERFVQRSKICSVNPLYFIFDKVNVYFQKNSRNKYLEKVCTNESKEKI